MLTEIKTLPEWLMVGFSGHRDISNPEAVEAKIGEVLDRLASEHGSLATVSSAARGADTLFLEAAKKRELPTLVILPSRRKQFEEAVSPAEWSRVRPHLEHTFQVEEITASSGDDAYLEVGESIVEQADVVLAVWDGEKAAGPGGTGDAVEYATTTGKPLIRINPLTLEVTPTKFDFLKRKKFSAAFQGKPGEVLENYLGDGDRAAKGNAWWARVLVLLLVLMHLVASAIGVSIPVFQIEGPAEVVIAVLELLLLLVATVLVFVHHGKHSEWLRERIEMEICRSFNATWELRGLSGSFAVTVIPGYESFSKNLRILRAQDRTTPAGWQEIRERYRQGRILHQKNYFNDRAKRAKNRHNALQAVAKISTTGATLMTAVVLFMVLGHEGGMKFHVIKYLSIVLPLLSAAFFSIILMNEHGRRVERYKEMVGFLDQSGKRLEAAKSISMLVRVAAETEEVLLREVIEWHSFTRFAGKLH